MGMRDPAAPCWVEAILRTSVLDDSFPLSELFFHGEANANFPIKLGNSVAK